MKRIILAGLATVWLAAPATAEGLNGVFQTEPNDDGNYGHVSFAPCGDAVCGTLIKSFDSAGAVIDSKHVGKNIVWDMQDRGNGSFAKGKILDPGADKTYKSKMTLDGDTLVVSGCVGPICKKKRWQRVQ